MSANERESGPPYFVAEVIVFFDFPRFRRLSRYFNICKISCVLISFPRFCKFLRMFHIFKIFKILQYALDFWRFLQILTDCVIFSRFIKNFINLQATASAADPSSTRCFDDRMTRFHDSMLNFSKDFMRCLGFPWISGVGPLYTQSQLAAISWIVWWFS